MNNKSSVVIIGAGEIGSAIGGLLKKKDVHVDLWDKNIDIVKYQKTLTEIIPSADFLFFCVPSPAMIEAVRTALPHLNKLTIVVSLSKGIEESSKDTMDKLLERILPDGQNFAILGGPMLAEELSKGMAGIGVVSVKEKDTFIKLAELFEDTNLFVEYSDDTYGVALASVLKNIYAIALGIADGLNWGDNQKGWLVTKSLQEMAKIAVTLGCKEEVIYGTAGLGDLIATGYSPHSRNRQVGEEIIKTGQYLQSEGYRALPVIIDLLGEKRLGLRVLFALKQVFLEKQNAKTIFGQFLFRQSE